MRRRTALAALGGLALTACEPVVQVAGKPGVAFQGPRLEPRALVSFDGARLPMQAWAPEEEPWAAVVGLHGMNDYAAAFGLAGPDWAQMGIATYAYDQRGFGRTADRGVWPGADLMEEDLRTAAALVRARHPGAVLAVVGESMGGAVAIAAFASDRPPAADRLVLAAPAVWGWRTQPISSQALLWVAAHVMPASRLTAPDWLVRRIQASDNIEELRRMSRDRNMIFETRVDAIYGLVDLMQQGADDIGRVAAPTLFLYGARDQIIPKAAAFAAARKLKPTDRSAYYRGGYHLLMRDLERRTVLEDIARFIRDPAAPLPSGAPVVPGAPTPPNARAHPAAQAELAARPRNASPASGARRQ